MIRAAHRARDAGESLIEIVVAVFILGVAAVAIVDSFAVSIKLSDVHRKEANAASYVRDYAEAIQNWVAGTGHYQNCAGTDYYKPATVGYTTLPPGYRATQAAALTWSGTAWTTCTADPGFQRITLTIASSDSRAVESLSVVLRQPCRQTDSPCS